MPSTLGTLSNLSNTDEIGESVGIWTATVGSTAVGTGAIQVFTDTVTGSAPVAVTAGPPFTVTLSANPPNLTVGATSALTASVVDQSGNPVDDGTPVDFATDRGTVQTPGATINGIATSSISSTLSGTAHITATSGGRSGSATVVFTAGAPVTLSIETAPNGTGTPINAQTMSVYDALTVYAVTYDLYRHGRLFCSQT